MARVKAIQVGFLRSVQPKQYEKIEPEVRFWLDADEDENVDHMAVARDLMRDAATVVYNGLGVANLPERISAALGTPVTGPKGNLKLGTPVSGMPDDDDDDLDDDEPAPKPKRGRPPKAAKKPATKKKAAAPADDLPDDDDLDDDEPAPKPKRGRPKKKAAAPVDDLPDDDDDDDDDDEPNIRSSPENRRDPDDDDDDLDDAEDFGDDDDDDDDEEEEPAPKPKRGRPKKAAAPKPKRGRPKKAAAPVDDLPDDDEDDDDDEDFEEDDDDDDDDDAMDGADLHKHINAMIADARLDPQAVLEILKGYGVKRIAHLSEDNIPAVKRAIDKLTNKKKK